MPRQSINTKYSGTKDEGQKCTCGAALNTPLFHGYKARNGTRIQLKFTAGNLLEPAAMLGHKTTIWSPSHNAMHVIITYQSTTTHGIW
jgi:hypothetical protein